MRWFDISVTWMWCTVHMRSEELKFRAVLEVLEWLYMYSCFNQCNRQELLIQCKETIQGAMHSVLTSNPWGEMPMDLPHSGLGYALRLTSASICTPYMSWTSVAPGYCSASSILICQILKEYTNDWTRYLQLSLTQLRLFMLFLQEKSYRLQESWENPQPECLK